jgi:hypothetical protein
MDVSAESRTIKSWSISESEENKLIASSDQSSRELKVVLVKNFEFSLPLSWLLASPVSTATGKAAAPVATKLRVRFSLWENNLPIDALPLEGWIELQLLPEQELVAMAF